MIKKLLASLYRFLTNHRPYIVLTAVAAGLYPLVYNYDSNFTLVSSWQQFLNFTVVCLLLPIIIVTLSYWTVKKISVLSPLEKFVLPVLNFTIFTSLMMLSIYGFQKKILLLALTIAVLLALLFFRHYKKVVLIQLLMVLVTLVTLIPYLLREMRYDHSWTQLPDNIEDARFKKQPNVYVIQPDGYANFSEMEKDHYNFDNTEFESFLIDNNFKLYPNFRSNYSNTVSSNSSMFAMRHHYYDRPYPDERNPNRYRKVIAGNNPVIAAFKKNGYTTSLLLDKSYALLNRPVLLYDYCNISYSDIPIFSRGFDHTEKILGKLDSLMTSRANLNNFYFVEKIKPGHIPVLKSDSEGWEAEREVYFNELREANIWLQDIIDLIVKKDSNSLIVLVSDHGGYVGWNYTGERRKKTQDEQLIRSVFSNMLAIRWPNNRAPEYDLQLRSNVNLFRVLLTYLSENAGYLDALEPDSSFLIINEGAPFGVYEVIDDKGNIVFNKFSK